MITAHPYETREDRSYRMSENAIEQQERIRNRQQQTSPSPATAEAFETQIRNQATEVPEANLPPIPDPTGPFPIRNACPKCGARPYEQCKGARGPRQRAHTERYWAQAGAKPVAPNTGELATAKAINAAIGGLPTAPPTPPDPNDKRTALDKAVEALVRQHTSGAVIEAAWAAAHRIFAEK